LRVAGTGENIAQKGPAFTGPKEVTVPYARDLPSLDQDWSHWAIEGDGCFFAYVSINEPLRALQLIADNRGRFREIAVWRARPANTPDGYERQEGRRWLM
jgi:hypothetical protein